MAQRKKKTAAKASAPAGRSVAGRHFVAAAVLAVSIAAAYANSLDATWALDDVVANRPVAMSDILELVGFRKVAVASFVLNQQFAPFSPAYFRVFNIAVHIMNALLVYLLAYKTVILSLSATGGRPQNALIPERLAEPPSGASDRAFAAALISGVVFGLHPLATNAVTYIVQRMASLATLFTLLSLHWYLMAATSPTMTRKTFLYVACIACIIVGILSKENAVMAVPLIALYDFVFLSRTNTRLFFRRLAPILAVGLITIGTVSYALGLHATLLDLAGMLLKPTDPLPERGWMATDVHWTPLQHVLTEFRVVSRYLFLILAPLPQFLIFDWWGFPLSTGILTPVTTLLSLLFLSGLLVVAVLASKRLPLLSFGILWYMVAVALESFFALGSDLYFEHRNYLPLTGLLIGAAGQTAASFTFPFRKAVVWSIVAALALGLGTLTALRNAVWKDSLSLWSDTLRKAPSNLRAALAMGNAYLQLWDIPNAEAYYKLVAAASGRARKAYYFDKSSYSLGMLYLSQGKLAEAKAVIDTLENAVESYRPEILKGFYKALSGDPQGALALYRGVIDKTRGIDTVVVFTLMGDAYIKDGMPDNALDRYRAALDVDPTFAAAHYGMGVAYMSKKKVDLAADHFRKALALDPRHVFALADMADVMLIRKSYGEALAFAQRATAESPPFYQPYLSMANVLLAMKKDREAEEFYARARAHGMPGYLVPFAKARIYYLQGDTAQAARYLSEVQKMRGSPDMKEGTEAPKMPR